MGIIHCCKGCPDRKIVDGKRCHSTCERYLKEAAENQKRLDAAYEESKNNEYFSETVAKRFDRDVKYKKRRKYG